jgi:hypothetical protein
MSADEWIDRYAAALGVAPPSAEERRTLLSLAGVAAHASERIAAPIACWLSARAGVTPDAALEAASGIASA